jgi:hypothetical protein
MKKSLSTIAVILLGFGSAIANEHCPSYEKPLYEKCFDISDKLEYILDGYYDKNGNYVDVGRWELPFQTQLSGFGDCEDQAAHLWYLCYKNNIQARMVLGDVKSEGESGPHMWVELDYKGRTLILDTTYEGDTKGIFDKECLEYQDKIKYTEYDGPAKRLKVQNFRDLIISIDNFRMQNNAPDFSKINKSQNNSPNFTQYQDSRKTLRNKLKRLFRR